MGIKNTHWYASERTASLCPGQKVGESVHQVLDSSSRWRDVRDIYDVKHYGLAPGCTSVCGMLSKPGLYIWGDNILSAESYEMAKRGEHQDLTPEEWKKKLLDSKQAIGRKAADEGSVIHGVIEDAILTKRLHLSEDENVRQVAALVTQMAIDFSHQGFEMVEMIAEKSFVLDDIITFGGRTDLLIMFEEMKGNGSLYVVIDFKTRDFTFDDVRKANRSRDRQNRTFGKLTPRDTEPMQIAANLIGHIGDTGPLKPDSKVRIEGGNLYLSRTNPGASWYYPYTQEQLRNGWLSFQAAEMLYRNTVLQGSAQKTEVCK